MYNRECEHSQNLLSTTSCQFIDFVSDRWTRNPSLSLTNPSVLHESVARTSNSSSGCLQPTPAKLEHCDQEDIRYCRIELFSVWFPQVDPKHPRAHTFRAWRSQQEVLLMTATMVSFLVLVLNIIATIVVRTKFTATMGVVSIYEGNCSWVKNVDTVIHIFINIMSTLLLGASNLCMQLLAAPTRTEVDKAHKKRRWLDIGVPSWRNLRSISRTRSAIWYILGLSSVPLHFM